MAKKKLLILGDTGLNIELVNQLKKSYNVHLEDKAYKIKEVKASIVIASDDMENVAKYCYKKTYLIYLSSDVVFSGINVEYGTDALTDSDTDEGKLKIEEEKLVRQQDKHLIIRHSDILTKTKLEKIIQDIRGADTVIYDNKKQIYPMLAEDLAEVIDALIDLKTTGVIHIRGQKTTKYKMALEIAKFKNVHRHKIESNFRSFGRLVNIKLLGIILPKTLIEIVKRLEET